MKLKKPYPEGHSVNPNGKYGPRRHPISGGIKKHRGIDISGVFPVTAAADGVVRKVSFNGNKRTGGGHVVIIDHGSVHTVYYHGKHAPSFKAGYRIKEGEFIYTSGTTGASTGNHLHFEVRSSARWGTDVDPIPYLEGYVTGQLSVTGRLDRATWREWQKDLKESGLYSGRIDGIPGKLTWSAVQRSVVDYGYKGPIDGIPGPMTRRAVQKRVGVKEDGIWGRITISEIQRRLNEGKM